MRRPKEMSGFLAAVLVAVGSAVLVRAWWLGNSLCCDEIYVALNLERRSFRGLVTPPLEYDQVAPAGWLWLEHVAYLVGGHDELVLRLPALVGGCATLGLLAVVARQLFAGPVALVPVALAVGAPQLIYYSVQLKPYALECATTLLLVSLGLRVIRGGGRFAAAALWLAGAVAMWFAVTAVFALAGVGLVVVVRDLVARRWRPACWHLGLAAPAGASLATLYLLQARHRATWINDWWAQHYPISFPTYPLTPGRALSWTRETFVGFVELAWGVPRWPGLLAFGLAVGAVALLVRRPGPGTVVLAPMVLGYLLALLHFYPFAQRTAVWLVPVALLLYGAVAQAGSTLLGWAWRRSRHGNRLGRWALVASAGLPVLAVLAVLVRVQAPVYGRTPAFAQQAHFPLSREAMIYVARLQRPADAVFVQRFIGQVARWYAPEVGLRWDGQFEVGEGQVCVDDLVRQRLAGVDRVVAVVVTPPPSPSPRPPTEFRAMLGRYGRPLGETRFGRMVVLVYRVDLDARPDPPAGTPCMKVRAKNPYAKR